MPFGNGKLPSTICTFVSFGFVRWSFTHWPAPLLCPCWNQNIIAVYLHIAYMQRKHTIYIHIRRICNAHTPPHHPFPFRSLKCHTKNGNDFSCVHRAHNVNTYIYIHYKVWTHSSRTQSVLPYDFNVMSASLLSTIIYLTIQYIHLYTMYILYYMCVYVMVVYIVYCTEVHIWSGTPSPVQLHECSGKSFCANADVLALGKFVPEFMLPRRVQRFYLCI